ncbi:MAG: ComEA family DNA-binding protein [Patescibacteria group bacterium]
MEHEQIEKLLPILKQYRLPILLATAGLIFFVYGLIGFLGSVSKSNEIKFESDNQASTPIESGTKSQSLISIDIEGAVVNPGVYKLKQGSIVQDGLILAGGLSEDADREFVSKNINLASKLTDGAKIYVPKNDETTSQVKGTSAFALDLININLASAESLDTLPGIGAVTAEKIINNRPYAAINELLDKKAVSAKVFTQIKDKITAY